MMAAMHSRTIRGLVGTEVRALLRSYRRGTSDPTVRMAADGIWRATRTPEGPATTNYRIDVDAVHVRAWGDGAGWAVEQAPALCGALDDVSTFRPDHPLVAELWRRRPGLRIGATGTVFETLVPTILEQKVIGRQARRSYAQMVWRLGEPAPGPAPRALRLPPTPARLAATPPFAFHPWNVEEKRAATIGRAARAAARLDATVALPRREAYRTMTAVSGIGPWTAAEVGAVALGDPDAVSVGDFHLPNLVSWVLAGEARGDDDRMLELLEPFRGHRGRVIRLLGSAGTPPKFGPRLPLVDIAGI